MQTLRFGIVGLGLMGKEFASAAARWCHLTGPGLRPVITAVCSRNPTEKKTAWYRQNFASISLVTDDYRAVVSSPEVDALYVAVPHDLHAEMYCAAIDAGKHLLGEKPFGIDLEANRAITARIAERPDGVVRCASQYIYYPAVQRMLAMLEEGAFGRIIRVDSEFSHCSDLNPAKPINWKRMVRFNGEYGVMGDLGAHIALVPARAGWVPANTRAICSDIVPRRPDGKGGTAVCETWDNVTLLTELLDSRTGEGFPWTLAVNRIMPGEMNTWRTAIHGTRACARFSLKNPRTLELLRYDGGEQAWQRIDMGFDTAYPTITGGIFEFGSVDAFMQLMAAFMYEVEHGRPLNFAAACPTPAELHWCHRVFTAGLESNRTGSTAAVQPD